MISSIAWVFQVLLSTVGLNMKQSLLWRRIARLMSYASTRVTAGNITAGKVRNQYHMHGCTTHQEEVLIKAINAARAATQPTLHGFQRSSVIDDLRLQAIFGNNRRNADQVAKILKDISDLTPLRWETTYPPETTLSILMRQPRGEIAASDTSQRVWDYFQRLVGVFAS